MSLLTPDDLYYFNEGRAFRLFDRMGAHLNGKGGVDFAVWAPNAKAVSVIGDFNGWKKGVDFLSPMGHSGIWSGHVERAHKGDVYKFHIHSHVHNQHLEKADPFAFCTEKLPGTGSVIWDLGYEWQDQEWMAQRWKHQQRNAPISVYEVHLGSWRQKWEDGHRSLSYAEMADELVAYVAEMGFTHVEFLPVMEHPFTGSWGYQVTGYFAPTRRYGDPQDLMHLIDKLHQAGIAVILDWVPSHFAVDDYALVKFDGTSLYEHEDPRQGYHPDWGSYIFNYDRNEVRSFLISNAMFWLEKYHVDALRVDAVASMLYLDYSRKAGEWIPNNEGGRENKGATRFLRDLNEAVYNNFPDIQMIAEESTAWSGVSRPVDMGGLGFGFKWDMGWMHDTLHYFQHDPIHRKYHQNDLTFRAIYAFTENFMLPLSHDEVVHGKGSLLRKMAGDDWQKFANLRALYTYMYSQPGKKLLFMGNEFAQWDEWNHHQSLDWHLLGFDRHHQMQALVRDLNHLYKNETALQIDCEPTGFEWVDASDNAQSILSYLRKNPETGETIFCIFNLTPMPRHDYEIGLALPGAWQEIFNSDALHYGGNGFVNGTVETIMVPSHGQAQSVSLVLPALSGVFLKYRAHKK
ncbi:MAG: 1,4-alpha-glucan branching enzyme [Alphaproteobacteria bacterium]|nr:1,4-alpha-glucan branching enzyme [Alphaproteobacteria bacterium]